MISNRHTHTYTSVSKQQTRIRNWELVKINAPWAFEPDQNFRLRCGWVELLGDTGHQMARVLKDAKAIPPPNFIGVDTCAKNIERNRQVFSTCTYVQGDIYRAETYKQLKDLKIGIINLDGYGEVGSSGVETELQAIWPLVSKSLDVWHNCVLFLNKDLDSARHAKRGGRAAAMHRHVDMIQKAFKGYLPGTKIGDILPNDCDRELNDPKWQGRLGNFDIYKGKSGGERMAHLRLFL